MEKCKSNWVPGQVLTVDEQLEKYRGGCGFKVFIKSKPGKYGIKVFMLCDADKLYCINGFPYLGRGTIDVELPRSKYIY